VKGHQDDRDVRPRRCQRLDHLGAGHVRHLLVEQNQIRALGQGFAQPFAAVAGHTDPVAVWPQDILHHKFTILPAIIYDQNMLTGHAIPLHPQSALQGSIVDIIAAHHLSAEGNVFSRRCIGIGVKR